MIDDIYKKYKYVKEYDQSADIPESFMSELLERTWKVTPSKNNFMPYKVHVLGPDQQDLKNKIYEKAWQHEYKQEVQHRPDGKLPRFHNIVSCSYLLIFTQRTEDQPNPYQKHMIDLGRNYSQINPARIDEHYTNSLLEIGMFCNTLAALCLEYRIDISHTLCFPKKLENWKEAEWEFLDRRPDFMMTIGKGLTYIRDTYIGLEVLDTRPDYARIVNFVKNEQIVEAPIRKLIDSKSTVIEAVVEWQKNNYPNRTDDYVKCHRDLNLVFDAYVSDLNLKKISNINKISNISHIASRYWIKDVRQIQNLEVETNVHKFLINYIIDNVLDDEETKDQLLSLNDIFLDILTNGQSKIPTSFV
jgi:hypothetical protein